MKDTADAIGEMVSIFLPHCDDESTLSELKYMASDHTKWREAHKLFSRIRGKNLKAIAASNQRLQCQYSFEEYCAKTLYNIADHSAGFSSEYLPPFDGHAPSAVVPLAVALAEELGMDGMSFESFKARIEVAVQDD